MSDSGERIRLPPPVRTGVPTAYAANGISITLNFIPNGRVLEDDLRTQLKDINHAADPSHRKIRSLPCMLGQGGWLCFPPNSANLMAPEIRRLMYKLNPPGSEYPFKLTRIFDLKTAYDGVIYWPRSPQFCGLPQLMMPFTVRGVPGLKLVDLVKKGSVRIDGAAGIMPPSQWMAVQLDWPTLKSQPLVIPLVSSMGYLAQIVARLALNYIRVVKTCDSLKSLPPGPNANWVYPFTWNLLTMDVGQIRLLGLTYYAAQKVWVPILACSLPTFEFRQAINPDCMLDAINAGHREQE